MDGEGTKSLEEIARVMERDFLYECGGRPGSGGLWIKCLTGGAGGWGGAVGTVGCACGLRVARRS